jgi:hypothetical protein
MPTTYNIYCDESCHLEHDGQSAMVLGAVWCPIEKVKEAATRLREIKARHGFGPLFEVKWTKVSASKQTLYIDLVDYFFDDDDLHFRSLVVPDKGKLNHAAFTGQNHDVWYYKMYFDMLKVLLGPGDKYRIYIDIKDTRGTEKVRKLHDVLCNNLYDFERSIVERVQQVRSHEIELLQLADLLIGAVSYVNRGLDGNVGKLAVVDRIRKRSGYRLDRTTLLREEKLNLFRWQAQEAQA